MLLAFYDKRLELEKNTRIEQVTNRATTAAVRLNYADMFCQRTIEQPWQPPLMRVKNWEDATWGRSLMTLFTPMDIPMYLACG